MTSWILDASAVLAFLLNESGADEVRKRLPDGQWSAVNYGEVLARLTELSGSFENTRAAVDQLELELIPFDAAQAALAASLRPPTRQYGLSLGDRACLALALTSRAPVLTCDRSWSKIDLGIEVIQVRPTT